MHLWVWDIMSNFGRNWKNGIVLCARISASNYIMYSVCTYVYVCACEEGGGMVRNWGCFG